jgi:hypothetical protein
MEIEAKGAGSSDPRTSNYGKSAASAGNAGPSTLGRHHDHPRTASARSGSLLVAVLVAVRLGLRLFADVRTTDVTCAVASREPR